MTSLRVEEKQELTSPPGKFVAVYITAKLIHAQTLVGMRKDWPNIYFTARWPLTANMPSEGAKPAALWTKDNETDMAAADVVLGYSSPQETTPLRDPLWELGEAHAMRKPIYLAGPVDNFGKYAFCSSIVGRYETLLHALTSICRLNNYSSHADKINERFDELNKRIDKLASGTLKVVDGASSNA